MDTNQTQPPVKKRIEAIDAFRGFTIFAMIFVIMTAGYKNLPWRFPQVNSVPVTTFKHAGEDDGVQDWKRWEEKHPGVQYSLGEVVSVDNSIPTMKFETDTTVPPTIVQAKVWTPKRLHPGDEVVMVQKNGSVSYQLRGIGVTFTDWVAPFFVFIVGLCIPLSRMRRGSDWWKHVGVRTIGLILAGVIYISLIKYLSYWWGILQAIGIAYFIGAAFMLLPYYRRWIAFVLLAAFHAVMSYQFPWWLELGDPAKGFWTVVNPAGDMLRPLIIHCTPWASISYGLCTIAGTFLGEAVATKEPKQIISQSLILGAIFLVSGYIIHIMGIPMHKDYVSISYSIFTSGIACIVFLAFYYLIDVLQWKKGWCWFLSVFGANALLAYFLQAIVRIFMKPLGLYDGLTGKAGMQGVIAGLEWTLLLWCITLYCNRKNWYWKL